MPPRSSGSGGHSAQRRRSPQVLDGLSADTLDTIEGIADPRVQALIVVSAPGLYALIMTSRKDAARRFRRWVTHEVLPSIQRTGGLLLGPPPQPPPPRGGGGHAGKP